MTQRIFTSHVPAGGVVEIKEDGGSVTCEVRGADGKVIATYDLDLAGSAEHGILIERYPEQAYVQALAVELNVPITEPVGGGEPVLTDRGISPQ